MAKHVIILFHLYFFSSTTNSLEFHSLSDPRSLLLLNPSKCPIMEKQQRVIIMGAGIFGLSTARQLAIEGYQNITILDRHMPPVGFWSIFKEDMSLMKLGARWLKLRYLSRSPLRLRR